MLGSFWWVEYQGEGTTPKGCPKRWTLRIEGSGLRPRVNKGTLLGTPNREPQEYSRNIMEYKDPGKYIPIIHLPYS